MKLQARTLVAGNAAGLAMKLRRPLSFWGGVDVTTGIIVDAQSDGFGDKIAGRVLALEALRGSSSSSSVLLELIHAGAAPAALIVAQADAILIAGLLAARELGWNYPPLLELAAEHQVLLPDAIIDVRADGVLQWE